MRKTSLFLAALGLAAVAGVVAVETVQTHTPAPVSADAKADALGQLPLTGGDGQPTSLAALRGSWLVVLFGYTSCPDVCPTSLAYLAQEMPQLGDLAPRVKGVFISVDPQRDAAAAVGRYAKSFDERFVGLTGTEATLRTLAKGLGAYFEYQKDAGSAAGYLVMHTGSFFLIDPNGRLAGTVSPPFARGNVADTLKRLSLEAH